MTNVILTLVLALGIMVVFYRFAVRPLLKSAFVDRICRYEAMLEKMASEGRVGRNDFPYQFLKSRFQIKNRLNFLSISGFLHFLICRDKNTKPTDDIAKFNNESSGEIKDLHHAVCRDILRWTVINSPSYLLVGAVVIFCIMIYRSMNEERIVNEAYQFADYQADGIPC